MTALARNASGVAAALLLVAVANLVPALAIVPAWQGSERVNDDIGSAAQTAPDLAVGPGGDIVAVWQDHRNGGHADIYLSARGSLGWSANVRVNADGGTAHQYAPRIGIDAAGTAVIAWQDARNAATGWDIYAATRSAAGALGPNLRVNDDTKAAIQSAPDVAVAPDGSAVAVWLDNRNNRRAVYGARMAPGAPAWSPNLRASANDRSAKATPDVAIGPDGTAWAVWTDDRSGHRDIWLARLAPGAGAWSPEEKVSDDPGRAAQDLPEVAVDGSGDVIVTWVDFRSGSETTGVAELRARRWDAATGEWSPSVAVAGPVGKPKAGDVAAGADGRAIVVWEDAATTAWRVLASELDPVAGTWSVPTVVTETTGSATAPAVAYTGDGVALAFRAGNPDADVFVRRRLD